MNISIWNIFEYIFRWKWLIAIIVALSLCLAYFYVSSNQTYTAEIIIKYVDENAKKGLTPQNDPLDVYEIMSPNILTDTINDLGLKIGVEDIKKSLVIEPIIPEEEAKIKENKIKANEPYSYFPIYYSVRYTVGSSKSGEFARDVLDKIMYYYHKFYSENYLNHTSIPQLDYKSKISFYDYLEIADFMKDDTSYIINYVDNMAQSFPEFRSPNTGLSFGDLRNDYKVVQDFELNALYTDIFSGQVTQNEDVLLKVYKYKKEQNLLKNKNKQEETTATLGLMDQYVESNGKVINSRDRTDGGGDNFDTKEIVINDKPSKAKTTYDDLVDKYVSSGVMAGSYSFDAQYCDDVMKIFSSNNTVSTKEQVDNVVNDINAISEKLNDMHDTLNILINDFNRYTAGSHIVSLSNISLFNNLSSRLYILIALAVGLMVGIVLAIAIEIIGKYLKKNKSCPVYFENYNKNEGASL